MLGELSQAGNDTRCSSLLTSATPTISRKKSSLTDNASSLTAICSSLENLEVADGVLEFVFCNFELPFELNNARNVSRRYAAAPDDLRLRLLDKADQQ